MNTGGKEMSDCPMGRRDKNRLQPKNMAVAMAFQLHDDVRVFYAAAYSGNPKTIASVLGTIRAIVFLGS
jgi:hypothetical protein